MSERKRGSLDYTARAFPGARDPDGPAPGLEDQLADLGLVEREDTNDVRSGVPVGAKAGAKAGARKRGGLEYMPQAFPGARDPDGPAPGVAERLVQLGLAEREEAETPEPRARQVATYTPEPPRRERVTPPLAQQMFTQSPPPRREHVAATPQTRPISSPVTNTHQASSAETPAPLRQERVITPLPRSLPTVPAEVAPRPAPTMRASAATGANLDISAAVRPTDRPGRRIAVPKKRPEQEERVRRSVRLVASVDAKLNDLAHLRGLDINTAVGVAIVADWVACFGVVGQNLKGQAS